MNRVDSTSLVPIAEPATEVVVPITKRKQIPTVEWVSRDTKEEVEKAVKDEQAFDLCDFRTSKR